MNTATTTMKNKRPAFHTLLLPAFAALLATIVLFTAAPAVQAAGGKVTLKDGRVFEGPLIISDQKVGVATEEGLRLFDRSEIESIEDDPATKATPDQRRAYRQAYDKVSRARTPEEALKIWLEYLEGRPEDDPMKAVAREQLNNWSDAARQGKVIWAGRLMMPDERDELKTDAARKLQKAAAMNATGRTGEALPLLRDAIRKWPDHPGIQFHLALALQRDRKPNDAAKYYRKVMQNHHNHVPTLNNLAALECTRRQFLVGVPLMLQAMDLGGDVVLINDNGYRTLLRMEQAGLRGFEEERNKLHNAVVQLEAVMRTRGLTRWGTSWVTRERYEQYVAANRQIEAQLEAMAAEITSLESEAIILKTRIAELQRQRLTAPTEADLLRPHTTEDGTVIHPRVVYPAGTLTREKIDLMLADHLAQLAATEGRIADLLAQAQRLKAQRVDPPQSLDYLLLSEPGDELMLDHSSTPDSPPPPPPTVTPPMPTAAPSTSPPAEEEAD